MSDDDLDLNEAIERLNLIQEALESWVRPAGPIYETSTATEFVAALNVRGLKIVRAAK